MTGALRLIWLAAAAATTLPAVAPRIHYESNDGNRCTGCHEMQPSYDAWRMSTHRRIDCSGCHGGSFALNNLTRLVEHLRGQAPEQIHVRSVDIPDMLRRCQGCHGQEFADWQAGPHGVNYAKIFFDAEYNRKHPLMDDCLRCHGQHFPGGIKDVVKAGASVRDLPAIPCLACHQMHREGTPLEPKMKPEVARPSVALFDRRTMEHVAVANLPLPEMRDGDRKVKMSPDARQALCYQCHAPVATLKAGTGEDRTGIGVHEGISCLACHQKHGQQTRASCATCHPRLSNCGLDVEKMDTTFLNAKSRHNIHFVKCEDCHTKGVPRRHETRSAVPISSADRAR